MVWKWFKMILSVALCYCAWIGISPVFYEWYFDSERTQWLRELYVFLNGRAWVNIPLCLMILYWCVLGIIRLLKDEDIRPYRTGAIILLLMFLNLNYNVVYPCIIGEFRFNVFFNILLLSYLGIILFRLGNYFRTKISEKFVSKENSNSGGFTVDNEHEDKLSTNVKKYGETLVDQLLSTMKKHKQSIAVGITGEWGTGKTTFLNLLKNYLDKRAEIVEFNPWMCQTPEQVTRDFFASLRHQLSQKHSSLSKPISHYAKYLEKIRISILGSIWFESSPLIKTPSLLTLKNELSTKFRALDKPVAILIDDLDRLESKEVFEVLRLIRNTGDINNTIYITSFDKEYVTSVLKEIGCNTPSTYLEKIFPIELHLPKPEGYQIWEVFKDELRAQDTTCSGFADKLVNSFSNSDYELILNILTSYRKVKRFCRLFMLNSNFVARYYRSDFKYLDLFWIELLQFYDNRTYDSLARNALVLLYYDSSSNSYILREGITEKTTSKEVSNLYNGEKTWQPQTPKILQKLFGKYTTATSMSIRYPENYMKFFAIGLSEQKLSVNEFKHLIDGKHDYKQVIDEWIEQGKYISSIEYNLTQTNTNSLSNSELSDYLNGALYYGLKKQSWRNNNIRFLITILAKGNFNDEKRAQDIVKRWVQEQIKEAKNLLALSGMLKSLYSTKEYESENPNDFTMHPKVLSNNEIERILVIIAKTYLEKYSNTVNPLDILNKETQLFNLFDNCCIETESVPIEGFSHYNQTCFDVMIQFFKDYNPKPTIEEYNSCMSKLFYEPEPTPNSFEDPNDYYQWQAYNEERYNHQMTSHFGSGYNRRLNEFKSKCFQSPPTTSAESDTQPPLESKQNSKRISLSYRKTRIKKKGKRRGK